jgi:hypothetical protein
VTEPIDEATSRFLKTAQVDLQSRLGTIGTVEGLKVDDRSAGVSLVSRVRIGSRIVDYRATGKNLVEAYAALTHGIASREVGSQSPSYRA